MCVHARLPGTDLPVPIAVGRTTVLKHHKCLDVELLAAQALEQYCHNLKGHIPTSPGMESSQNDDVVGSLPLSNGNESASAGSQMVNGEGESESGRGGGGGGGGGKRRGQEEEEVKASAHERKRGKNKMKPTTWAELLQQDLEEVDEEEVEEERKKEEERKAKNTGVKKSQNTSNSYTAPIRASLKWTWIR